MRLVRLIIVSTSALAVAPGTARAQSQDSRLAISGFGGVAYGKTDGNVYTVGDRQGSYETAQMAIALLSSPIDRLQISSQFEWFQEGNRVELDYAFADWRLADALRVRVGRVKHPFGIYTEVFDVGTLRPFYTLPQGLYGPSGFIAEGLNGVAAAGFRKTGRWGLGYDVYFGEIDLLDSPIHPSADETGDDEEEEENSIRETAGARIRVETPVHGLTVGLSGYQAFRRSPTGDRRHAYGAHAEFLSARWSVRTEVARSRSGEAGVTTFFAELARRFSERRQVAVRYERLRPRGEGLEGPNGSSSLARHQEYAVGINHWMSANLAMKLSYHRVRGNRFARPSLDGVVEGLTPAINERTSLVVLGAQFSF